MALMLMMSKIAILQDNRTAVHLKCVFVHSPLSGTPCGNSQRDDRQKRREKIAAAIRRAADDARNGMPLVQFQRNEVLQLTLPNYG